jgi:predicted transcriptional regulator
VAQITIRDPLWENLVQLARKTRKKPESLAAEAVRDFLQRRADEDLLARSERAARRSRFPLAESEEIVRKHRRQKNGV